MNRNHLAEIAVRCAGCGNPEVSEFFRVDSSPVNCGTIPATREEALSATTGEIQLVYCANCGLVHNQAFDLERIDFQPGYEVALTHSSTFREFQNSVIKRLTEDFDLRGKQILEIGCGDASFLKSICQHGANHGIGIDPTVPFVGRENLESGSVELIREFFGKQHADRIGDFVCSLSMFEDIPAPLDFLVMLRRMIGDQSPDIYFEVFNGFRAFDELEIWSIHYEQCNYFNLAALERLFQHSGFEITNSGHCYQEDQYLFVEAKPTAGPLPDHQVQHSASLPDSIYSFSKLFEARKHEWNQRLTKMQSANQQVVLWGSGGKGISFLNGVAAAETIELVVDINPDRQDRFIPGTGQLIVPPRRLVQIRPDLIILTNPIYKQEIRAQVSELGLDPEFAFI